MISSRVAKSGAGVLAGSVDLRVDVPGKLSTTIRQRLKARRRIAPPRPGLAGLMAC
jgi:hypothetical protein